MNKKDKVKCDDIYKTWHALNRRFQWLSSYYKSLNKEKWLKKVCSKS